MPGWPEADLAASTNLIFHTCADPDWEASGLLLKVSSTWLQPQTRNQGWGRRGVKGVLGMQLTLKWFSANIDTQAQAASLRGDLLQLTSQL